MIMIIINEDYEFIEFIIDLILITLFSWNSINTLLSFHFSKIYLKVCKTKRKLSLKANKWEIVLLYFSIKSRCFVKCIVCTLLTYKFTSFSLMHFKHLLFNGNYLSVHFQYISCAMVCVANYNECAKMQYNETLQTKLQFRNWLL